MKGWLLLILGIGTTHKGQVWIWLGALGLAINMRATLIRGSVNNIKALLRWRSNSCRLEFVSIPSLGGGRVDRHPSFSLFSIYIYIIFPYLTLTLGLSSNTMYPYIPLSIRFYGLILLPIFQWELQACDVPTHSVVHKILWSDSITYSLDFPRISNKFVNQSTNVYKTMNCDCDSSGSFALK